jgi:serine/threonine protein kinase/formylglycine-generating enzyme required for sulfatase activity
MTSVQHSIAELRRFPRDKWLDLVRSDQSHRWRQGIGIFVEDYFLQLPEIRADTEEALVLITGELLLRREMGETLDIGEYEARFPEFADHIAVQFCVEDFLSSTDTVDALTASDEVHNLELPGYEFLGEIGRGAAGIVYQARQVSLDRYVAIKVLAMPVSDPKRLTRQRQEAEILARLQHPNIVHIYEVVEQFGCLYLVMEFIDGETLKDTANGKPIAASDAAGLVLTIALAMQAVHESGVLHRDLKPSNVLVASSGQIRITDFGLAKLRSSDNYLTTENSVLGTPSYMSPEQAIGGGHTAGAEADVFSMGAILYELLTGRPPHLGATVLDTLVLIREQDPVPPRQLQPLIPRDVQTICLKCLAKSPGDRYASAGALAEDLRRFLNGLPIIARPPGVSERVVRFVKRNTATSAAMASCALLAVLLLGALWINTRQHRRLSAEALVDAIATADANSLPQLLARLPDDRQNSLVVVRERLQGAAPHEPQWVNLNVGQLAADAEASGATLLAYLPAARPSEIPAIVQVLSSRSDALRTEVWQMLSDSARTDDSRLRLACLAAANWPDHPKWLPVAPAVAQGLVEQNPLDMGIFMELLRPARKPIIAALLARFREGELESFERLATIGILAKFGDDQPGTLVELIVDANPDEFRLLLPALARNRTAATRDLERIATGHVQYQDLAAQHAQGTKRDVDHDFDRSQRHRANATIALWHLGNASFVLHALGNESDPALRSWTLELLAPLGISVDAIWSQLQQATDSPLRQALILAIGQANFQQMSKAQNATLLSGLLEMYHDDADAGVHAACRWLLDCRLNAGDAVAAADKSAVLGVVDNRNWYLGANGHTWVVFRGPSKFKMGSPQFEPTREADEQLHEETIDYSFAISTTEVTITQCRPFRNRYFNHRYSPTDDCPANNITWFDAAAYCRGLSEAEGVPEDQMCYPPVAEIRPGMKLPDNFLQRTGYRLPTEIEWEYACRGGVSASRSCGEGEELPTRYVWYLKNSENRSWPVGRLKPNAYGLFDMLGNVAERCHEKMAPYTVNPTPDVSGLDDSPIFIRAADLRVLRGGNFGDIDHNVRSARRNANSVDDQWALTGFRVARTL